MKNPFDFFDKIFYINLDRRPDRREAMEAQFEKFGIKAQRFPAIDITTEQNEELIKRGCVFQDDSRPEYAPRIKSCTLSHLMVLSLSKILRFKNVLILEDDCTFEDDILEELTLSLEELDGKAWDMFYIGGNPLHFYKVSEHLGRGVSLLMTHAYAVNGHFIDFILTELNFIHRPCIDAFYCTLNHERIYMCLKNLARQSEGISDIEGKLLYYDTSDRYKDIKSPEIEYNEDIKKELNLVK